ncbi:phosphoesterase [bacterium endosymbiont of Escarpia laminata]|nr:MAG: phosphoesterase [bacterium endosymbiont of Escarpia laminata]RLJ20030.1 MAG: phosphoesterase [bacterium endosymbiont of Escarpia laminata]
MKLLVLSDLHIEFEAFDIAQRDVDVVILAGDIHVKERGLSWMRENIRDVPIIYVLGNHEYYGKAYPKLVHDMKERSAGTNVHILENSVFTMNGVNFLGCTLWTDFELFADARLTGYECQQIMTEYKKIRLSPKFSKLRSIDVASIHRQSLRWLDNELAKRAGELNIVVTHHGPSPRSLPRTGMNDVSNAAYVSNLEGLIEQRQPSYWIHGHLHNSSDYLIGNCRIICNPRGYPDERNREFNRQLSIDI